jgi:hypothetical protein
MYMQRHLQELYDWLSLNDTSLTTNRIVSSEFENVSYDVFADGVGATAWAQYDMARCLQDVIKLLHSKNTLRYHMYIYLVPTVLNYPKRFPDTGHIGRLDINSGMCSGYPPRPGINFRTVYVFRNHEIRKVFIHEILHALDYHPHGTSAGLKKVVTNIVQSIAKKHPWIAKLQKSIAFNEAVVESLACDMETEHGLRNRQAEHAHARKLARRFLAWGDKHANKATHGPQALLPYPSSDTHPIEYIVLRSMLIPHVHKLRLGRLTNAAILDIAKAL